MKKILLMIIVLSPLVAFSQDREDQVNTKGQAHFKVFWNYHYDYTKDVDQVSAFELTRVYLGYKYTFNDKISAKITYDIGKNDAGSKHTAFIKIAQLDYKINPSIKISMGLIGGKQYNDQEKHWGYRYIYKTLQDENKFGPSADLGINAELEISKVLMANLFIVNGEGYKNLQDDNGNQRFGMSLIYNPSKLITTKLYYDTHASENSKSLNNIAFFAGYKADSWKIGAEYNKMENGTSYKTAIDNHNLEGISVYGSYIFNDKIEIFARFDEISSNTLNGQNSSWNYEKDGILILFGAQYIAAKGVKFSINSRNFNYINDDIEDSSFIYFNAEFKL
ncbi:MAG: porin [Bacteroidota bacterium]|nr:porin [Bacteroidota bacterium]